MACASTGNTSASLAVYAARAGIPAVVLLPAGQVALGKVAQALMHGARVISIRGNFDRALEMVHELCLSHGLYLLNSVNPYRLEGQKTIGFEAVDQLGRMPDRFVLPVGNAGNISAVHKGLAELIQLWFRRHPSENDRDTGRRFCTGSRCDPEQPSRGGPGT